MATLVIKKELCKRFRRKGLWILAIFIIILAVSAFKVCGKFKRLHREIKDLKRDFATTDDLSDLRDSNYRQIRSLETRISSLSHSNGNSQNLDNILEIIRSQRQEIKDLTVQLRAIQQNQASSQTNNQNIRTMEGLQTQMRTLSYDLEQMKRENGLLKRQQLEMTQMYEKILSVSGKDGVDQDFKQAIRTKLSELVNANYGHEQTFKDVKRSVDNCAKQASLIALEAYIDDKLSTSTPPHQNSQATPSDAMLPVLREMKQMKRDLDQRVTALETQQQEDEMLKASFNEATAFIEKTLKDSEMFKNPQDLETTLSAYLKSMEQIYPELQEKIEKTLEQNMNLAQGNFGRRPHAHPHPHPHPHAHPRHSRRYENVEPARTHEKGFARQKQEVVNSVNLHDLAKKTSEELIQLMDQLLA